MIVENYRKPIDSQGPKIWLDEGFRRWNQGMEGPLTRIFFDDEMLSRWHLRSNSQVRVKRSGSGSADSPFGISYPKCSHALRVAMRPLGVRISNPCWMR